MPGPCNIFFKKPLAPPKHYINEADPLYSRNNFLPQKLQDEEKSHADSPAGSRNVYVFV